MAFPISAQQRRDEESRQEFDTRMLYMVARLESTDTIFFYKIISKSMATQEFPIDFITQHGRKFGIYVTFGLEDSQRTWPIELTVRFFKQSKARVFAFGPGGWKTFLMDNHIKVGDILVFSLISFSEFQVYIGRAPVEGHPDDNNDDNEDNEDDDKSSAKWFRNPSPWWNADQAPVSCRVCKHAPPCPRFLVTIRPSSRTRHFTSFGRQHEAVPGRFWELHDNMLECDDLQLRGPNKAICMVKANRTYDEEDGKLSVRLDSGWEAFRVANKLRVGDVLEFFLVGNSCFTVDLVERIEKD